MSILFSVKSNEYQLFILVISFVCLNSLSRGTFVELPYTEYTEDEQTMDRQFYRKLLATSLKIAEADNNVKAEQDFSKLNVNLKKAYITYDTMVLN